MTCSTPTIEGLWSGMSDSYVRQMQRVQSEYDTLVSSLRYVQIQWHRQDLLTALSGVTPSDIQRLLDNAEDIVFIRLFSLFEGILKEHLAEHHPGISVPEDARAVWLIDRVAQRQTPPIRAELRGRVHIVRRYRNFLIHRGGIALPVVSFSFALAQLSKFVSHLPEPR